MRRLAISLALVALAACGEGGAPSHGGGQGGGKGGGAPGGGRGPMKFPVEVMAIEPHEVEYAVNAVGSIEAFERVHVTARVAGAVEEVRFREGDLVKQGQVLARIESERYLLGVRAAEAKEKRVAATLREAQASLKRREDAVAERADLIPVEELESWRTKVHVAEAELLEAKAQREQAELNYRNSNPAAPVSGIIETRDVDTGAYVQAGTLLGTLIRREPMLLRFKVPEREARSLELGSIAQARMGASEAPLSAKITHVGQTAESSSRMVNVVAEVQSPPKTLRPGSFAEVSVRTGASDAAISVPELAVRPSERGFLAFVVEEGVAKERKLTLGLRTGDGRVEIQSGLKEGDQLVVRGNEALFDGAPVRIAEGEPDARAQSRVPAPPDAAPRPEEAEKKAAEPSR